MYNQMKEVYNSEQLSNSKRKRANVNSTQVKKTVVLPTLNERGFSVKRQISIIGLMLVFSSPLKGCLQTNMAPGSLLQMTTTDKGCGRGSASAMKC